MSYEYSIAKLLVLHVIIQVAIKEIGMVIITNSKSYIIGSTTSFDNTYWEAYKLVVISMDFIMEALMAFRQAKDLPFL